jgi:soluble lytic murein transglycosylase-like protein
MIGARAATGISIAILRRPLVRATALALVLACAAGPSARAQSGLIQTPSAAVSIADLIAEASRRFGVPAIWIAAVIRAESAFDPRATSHKGAMGLM